MEDLRSNQKNETRDSNQLQKANNGHLRVNPDKDKEAKEIERQSPLVPRLAFDIVPEI